ncbi:hypothetical protein FGO68_gene17303 [Halteria grandinella]|uniref:Uncharacterized protein n=1 Tax=Halteria grandinella TaxID=5974 RepID=A0A8J8SX47_HALGN|nr:hypothetical protein FGO68_gene17303 [Halteria grandinella]
MMSTTIVLGQYGTCDRGSDAKCERFGKDYCCAYVDIKSDKDQLKGYWCANMQYTGEKYNEEGYEGSVICSEAAQKFKNEFASILILIVVTIIAHF